MITHLFVLPGGHSHATYPRGLPRGELSFRKEGSNSIMINSYNSTAQSVWALAQWWNEESGGPGLDELGSDYLILQSRFGSPPLYRNSVSEAY